MRTTLDIDDELLPSLKVLSRQQGMSLGQLVSALVRQSLDEHRFEVRNGVRVFTSKNSTAKPGLRLVNALRDGE